MVSIVCFFFTFEILLHILGFFSCTETKFENVKNKQQPVRRLEGGERPLGFNFFSFFFRREEGSNF